MQPMLITQGDWGKDRFKVNKGFHYKQFHGVRNFSRGFNDF